MVNTTEQILLTLGARNNASGVFGQVDKDAKNMASSISSAISSINQGMMNLGSVTDNMMQGLTGKSAMDNIFGTASKAETNKVLVKNMLDTEKHFDSFYENVDKVTDSSLTSMQELMPALKAFKSATGATDKDVQSVTDEIANFGAAVLAQTGSTDMAQQSMMDLSKGIKGAFASLDQYGITQDALERTGYWNGDEKDVVGFMKAVQKVTGSTDELMETNAGLDAKIGKAFSRAGKKMGNEFLPVIKDIKKGFLELDDSLGGNLTASILATSAGIETANTAFWNISTAAQGIRDLSEGFQFLTDKIKGATEAAETANDAINTVSNVSDMGVGAGGALGASANIAEASKIGNAGQVSIDGFESFDDIDSLIDFKKEQKVTKEAEKEARKIIDRKENLLKNLADADDEKLIKKLKKGVASADAKITTGVLDENTTATLFKSLDNTQEALEKQDWGLSDAIRDSLSKQGTRITDAVEEGEESLQKGLKKMSDVPSKMTTSVSNFTESFSGTIKNFKDDGVKGNIKKFDQKLLNVFKGTEEISDALSVVDDVGDVGKDLKGADQIAEGVKDVASAGSAMAATGPELEAAAAGGAAVEAGATGLAATFTSLMVPLLAVSAAIIIMIPIVAFIAAEALIFIRILADFMEALNFDNINLDGAISGISQVATALAWVGVAMASMSFASIMTGLAVITGGFLGITGPLDIAINAIKEVGGKLAQFNTLSINSSVASNLQTISSSLMAVSSAMGALTWTNITTGFSNWIAGALGFSSVTEGLEQAKNDIINASQKLEEFSNLTPLDQGVADNIQNVCDSLASVGAAMEALRSMRDGQNWDNMIGDFMSGLFGDGLDIQQALNSVKEDITKASQSLQGFTDLQEIPDGVGDKIKKVSDVLTAMSEAFETLRGFRDDNIWDDMIGGLFGETDITTALDEIKTDLYYAVGSIKGLEGLPAVGDGIPEKIKKITDILTELSNVSTSLTSLPPMDGFDSSIITTAVTNVQTAATELSNLSGMTLGDDVNGLLGSINTALQTLKDTLGNAEGFSEPSLNIGTQIVSGVQSGLSPLAGTVTSQVSTATSSAASSGWTGGAYIGQSTTGGFQSALNLHTVMETEMGYVKTAVDNGIDAAKTAAENGAKEVVDAFKNGINVGSPGDIARAMEQEMLYTKDFIVGSYGYLKQSAFNAASLIVDSFGTPKLNLDYFNGNSTLNNIGALDTIISKAPTQQDNKTIIMYNNVTVDARNKTEQEAKSMLTLALEGMDNITNIDVDV